MLKGQHSQKNKLYKMDINNCLENKKIKNKMFKLFYQKQKKNKIYVVLVAVSLIKKQIYDKFIVSGEFTMANK